MGDIASGPCTTHIRPGEMAGAPCAACGHCNLLHPGYVNPTIKACVLCELVDQLAHVTAVVGVAQSSLNGIA